MVRLAREALRGSLWLSLGQVLAMAIGFAGSVVIARLLGPKDYGIVAISMTIPLAIYGYSDLGLSTAIIRYTAMGKYAHARLSFLLRIASGFIASVIVFMYASFFAELVKRPYIAPYIRLLSLYIFGFSVIDSVKSVLVGLGRYEKVAIIDPVRQILRVALSIILVLIGLGAYGVIVGQTTSSLITSILAAMLLYILLIKNKLITKTDTIKRRTNILKDIIKYSLPLYLPLALTTPLYKIIEIYIARFVPSKQFGWYNAATNVAMLLTIIGSSVETSIFSILSSIAKNKNALRSSIPGTVVYQAIIMIPLALIFAGISKPLIVIIYGHSYINASIYLSLLVLRWICSNIGSSTISVYIKVIGENTLITISGILHSIIHVAASILLIRDYGIIGMIIAYLIADTSSAIYYLLIGIYKYGLSIPLKKTSLITILASSFSLALYLLNNIITNNIYLIIIGILLLEIGVSTIWYILLIRKILSPTEFMELQEIVSSLIPPRIKPVIKKIYQILYKVY